MNENGSDAKFLNNGCNSLYAEHQYNQNQLLNVTLLTEVIMFWAHEFMFQAMGLYIIIKISPNFIIGVFFIICWIMLISSIYFSRLKKAILQSRDTEVRNTKYKGHGNDSFFLGPLKNSRSPFHKKVATILV